SKMLFSDMTTYLCSSAALSTHQRCHLPRFETIGSALLESSLLALDRIAQSLELAVQELEAGLEVQRVLHEFRRFDLGVHGIAVQTGLRRLAIEQVSGGSGIR